MLDNSLKVSSVVGSDSFANHILYIVYIMQKRMLSLPFIFSLVIIMLTSYLFYDIILNFRGSPWIFIRQFG
jgi:hypothetical protein